MSEMACPHCNGTGTLVQGAREKKMIGCCISQCQVCRGTGKLYGWDLKKMHEVSEQGKKFDGGKLRWALLPIKPIQEIIKVLMFGASKYGPNNWQNLENGKERYYEAAQRHMTAYWDGEKVDEESGKSHLAHAGCCILFMLWLELTGKSGK